MTFRNKILFSIWGVVLSLLVITFFLIYYWTQDRVNKTFSDELRSEYSTVSVYEKLHAEQLIRACIVVAESPRLRAVVEIGDVKTALQLMQDLYQTTLSPVFMLTDKHGKPIVQLLHGRQETWDVSGAPSVDQAVKFVASSDTWAVYGEVFRVVSVPIVVETELLGTLTIGFAISEDDIAALKRATNSDLLLVNKGSTILSTLDPITSHALLPIIHGLRWSNPGAGMDSAGSDINVTTPEETYVGRSYRLDQSMKADSGGIRYLLVKSMTREMQQSMASIMQTFGIVSLVFLALTTIIGLVISHGITRPIQHLVKGTTAISQGNYGYVFQIHGRDELSVLAQRFQEMSLSLKEKITQLGKLNQDLLERNSDLDETLRQLQAAQENLVRSERLAATGKLTAQLAHEINNPIHNIQSCLKTALNRLPEETRGRDLIEVAFDEVNRLSRLTGQMLDLYRASMVKEDLKPTDLREVIESVVNVTQQELQESGIALHLHIDPDLPHIPGSRDKLQQVLINLVSNARDAMPQGGILEIAALRQGPTVRMQVRDSGVGIPKENLSRVFDAFFTTKGKVSGVGLGLSVSYGIISQHRGTIEVASEVGRGSTFTVVLPYEG